MPDEINFVDLVALSRITPDTVFEKFGGLINSSYFDASNILGTLKQKKLVEFTNAFPGQSAVSVTDEGRAVLAEAEGKSKEEFDHLDQEIVTQLANGKRGITDLGGAVNVRPKDLAMHLNKLVQQQYAAYQVRNGEISVSLTEKGFLQVKSGMAPAQQLGGVMPAPQAEQRTGAITDIKPESVAEATGVSGGAGPKQARGAPLQDGDEAKELEKNIMQAKNRSMTAIAVAGGVLVLIIAALALRSAHII